MRATAADFDAELLPLEVLVRARLRALLRLLRGFELHEAEAAAVPRGGVLDDARLLRGAPLLGEPRKARRTGIKFYTVN